VKKNKRQIQKLSKFKDWACEFISCCTGCPNDCIYCYAKGDAVNKNRMTLQNWKNMVIRQHDIDKKRKLYDDPVMFPSTHDITDSNLDACQIVLNKLLNAGNRVLLVSKPRYNIVFKICNGNKNFKNNMVFRFTIGSMNDQILSFWEPNAPSYKERKSALKYAFKSGFRTSVSIEPMLDADNIEQLVDDLRPFVNHSIWIGIMNHFWYFDIDKSDVKTKEGLKRVDRNMKYFGKGMADRIKIERQKIIIGQNAENLNRIYRRLDNKTIAGNGKRLIYWKWHIRQALGLPHPESSEPWPTNTI
jgi:hypothetical protein